MPLTVEVTISDDLESVDEDVPDPESLQRWASSAYLDDKPAVVSMLVTTTDDIHQLNKRFRDKNQHTNVLSFPMQSPEEVDINLLGDLILCAAVINQEAQHQSKLPESHWAHMVVHGMLHLQGFDHIEDDEATIMESKEKEILEQLGIPDPYETNE